MKFSCLQKIAEMLNYIAARTVRRFSPLDFNDRVKTALRMLAPQSDEAGNYQAICL